MFIGFKFLLSTFDEYNNEYDILFTIPGAPAQTVCFRKIVDVLEILPDEEIINIAHFYFTKLQPT